MIITNDQIVSIIKAAFGDLAALTSYRKMSGGFNNALYEIETANPAHHAVLRIAPDDGLPFRCYEHERTDMLAEPHKYNLMKQGGVPTASVLASDGSRRIIDRDCLIVDFIDAVPMNHESVPADVRPRIMHEVGRYTALMHKITADKFGWITADGSVRGSTSWAEVFGELLTEACTKWLDTDMFTSDELIKLLKSYWDRRDVFDECRKPAFVHNDIWDPNIMVKEIDGQWKVEAFIDVDGALFADREFEFVLWENPDPDFMSGYGESVDQSENAILRRKFYRMQLYMQYSWFYLVYSKDPGFQQTAKKIAMDIMQEVSLDNQ